jgi:hypothetical protein
MPIWKVFLTLVVSIATHSSIAGTSQIKSKIEERSAKINFSLEFDQYRNTGYLNPAISYITPSEIEIGLSTYSVPLYGPQAQNFENDTYFNLSKKFRWSKQFSTIIGTQTGLSITNNNGIHIFDYIDNRIKPLSWLLIHAGVYYVNQKLSTTTSYVGAIAGIGFKLIPDKVHLTVDYYSGHSNVSGALVQVNYFTTSDVTLYLGVGVPEKHSGNEFYGFYGINYSY